MGKIVQKMVSALAHPMARAVDIDSPQTIQVHRAIIDSKPLLQHVYDYWYQQLLPSVHATSHLSLSMIELGCGASTLERFIPSIIKTDTVGHSNTDAVVDAESLPFADNALRAIFMVNVLHHLGHPERFLAEAQRCLAPGGRLVLIEPSNSPLNRFIIKYFHRHETWNYSNQTWTNCATGRLSNANNALASIIFERDRDRFCRQYPRLRLRDLTRHTVISYYLSGGLSYRSVVPSCAIPVMVFLRQALGPLSRWIGCWMTIEIQKS